MPDQQFIVVWDDYMGASYPMGWDDSCEGAIHARDDHVAVFPSRADARKAIRISAALARLHREQGKPVNEDFLSAREGLRIVPLRAKPPEGGA